jgi:hypothetical protein
VADRLDVETGVLGVHENEIVAGRLGDAGDVARARKARQQAQRNFPGLEYFLQRMRRGNCISHDGSPRRKRSGLR